MLATGFSMSVSRSVEAQKWPSIHGTDAPHYPAEGSTFVPLNSWVYSAIETLSSKRYIRSDFRGTRPWTRTECARLTQEAADRIDDAVRGGKNVAEIDADTLAALQDEFARELDVIAGARNRSLQMESVYARAMSISGPMLDDSYHFGQTISDDFGRPDRRGTNVIAGAAASATFGPFFAYADEEYQHAPSQPDYSATIQSAVLQMDIGQAFLPHGSEAINQAEPLDVYAGVNLWNWQISFGRESQWWGPDQTGGMLMSDNAEPLNGLRIERIVPFRLPSILGFLGPMHIAFVVGRMGGHLNSSVNCPPQDTVCGQGPWLENTRISFKPTDWFEMGISHAAIFGGQGFANSAGIFFKAFFPIDRLINQANSTYDNKQYMSWDFNLRFAHGVTWYSEFLGSDDPYPFSQISRTAIDSGFYFSRLPWVSPKLDLRLEGVYTSSPLNIPPGKINDGLLHYFGIRWAGGYTNDGFIIGNPVGRDGRRYGGWLTYHTSPKNLIQLNVMHSQNSAEFVPGGDDWTEYQVSVVQYMHKGFYLSGLVQGERLNCPILFAGIRNNVTTAFEVGYQFHAHGSGLGH